MCVHICANSQAQSYLSQTYGRNHCKTARTHLRKRVSKPIADHKSDTNEGAENNTQSESKNEPQSETSSRPRIRGPEHGLPNAVPKTVAIFWPQILANRGEARQLGLTPSCQNWWPENGPQKIAIFRPTPENRRQERDRQHAMTQRRKSKATNNRWTQG